MAETKQSSGKKPDTQTTPPKGNKPKPPATKRARVLVAGLIDGKRYEPNDLLEGSPELVEAEEQAGRVDTGARAVAIAAKVTRERLERAKAREQARRRRR